MANVRFGARFTTSAEKDLAYLQLQKDNDADFARAGELFINEPLEKIYFCDSVSGTFKELNKDISNLLTTADTDQISLSLAGQELSATIVANSITNAQLSSTVNASLTAANNALPAATYTATDILEKTKTVDGHGSGLDADTVDGMESTAFATAAQGALADTAIQPGAVGVTIQGYDANTVVDSAYVHTDNNYTTTEKNKLAGIADGAEVNVNADWNAVSGDAQILNKPTLGTAAATNSTDYATAAQGTLADTALQPTETETVSGNYTFNGALYLPNNSRINGVEHFYQTTKPTTRGDSSALVAGDRWWKTDDGTEWFWNGTYWLSPEIRSFSHRFLGSSGAFSIDLNISASTSINIGRLFFPLPIQFGESILLSKFQFLTDNVSGDGVWTVGVATADKFGNASSFVGNTVTPIAANVVYEGQISTVITKSSSDFILLFRAELSGTGSIRVTDYGIYYHLIAS